MIDRTQRAFGPTRAVRISSAMWLRSAVTSIMPIITIQIMPKTSNLVDADDHAAGGARDRVDDIEEDQADQHDAEQRPRRRKRDTGKAGPGVRALRRPCPRSPSPAGLRPPC